ncbi:MAG: addiction module protein [Desulfamplus sp.]|nr:addiction module protein [Desulfamplus sp.]
MLQNIEEITTELIKLPKRERLEIVRFLLFLDNRSPDTNSVDSAWEKEIADRVRAVDEGKAIGIDYDEAMQRIKKRFI